MTKEIDPQIATAVFRRNGGEGRKTKLFKNLSSDQRRLLQLAAGPSLKGEPIIAFINDDSEWLLITTFSVIVSQNSKLIFIDVAEINNIICDMEDLSNRGLEKDQWNEITIAYGSGQSVKVFLESGEPFFAIWNTLLWICRPSKDSVAKSR